MEGNEAASHVAYGMSETAFIYPISPATSMGEYVDKWSAQGQKNVFGQVVDVSTMQSEAGAAGAVHGAVTAGGLSTTFTASQGLLLMIPNMYLLAGELMPTVFHVSARTVAKHALSIFNDHSDVMAIRQCGWAMLCSNSVQEIMDLALVSHVSAIKARLPFVHFFDGFRTSAQINNCEIIEYEKMFPLVPQKELEEHLRNLALNPVHPIIRGTGQRPDIFMQNSVASNKYYLNCPSVVEETLEEVFKITGRRYHLFDYYGHPEADRLIVIMGSASRTCEEVVDYLGNKGEKLAVLKVRLYRPWSAEHLLAAIPKSVKKICVLDRTKEEGALGMPLYLDVSVSFAEAQRQCVIVGGTYGLASKEFTPAMAKAVYDNLLEDKPKNRFVIGIHDDVTHTSLPYGEEFLCLPPGTKQCVVWGFGTDGTVGANKAAIKLLSEQTDLHVQGHFSYDSHKGGGVTMSHLRFGPHPFKGEYEVNQDADYIACHKATYVCKFDMLTPIKEGGTFLLNCGWDMEKLNFEIPNKVKELIAKRKVKFYTLDGTSIALAAGLGQRVNTVMQAAFYHLSQVLPAEDAIRLLKDDIAKTYGKKGPKIVAMNHAGVDQSIQGLRQVDYPADWANALSDPKYAHAKTFEVLHQPEDFKFVADKLNEDNTFVKNVMEPVVKLEGDKLPVSAFTPGGFMPVGTTKYEKRGIAAEVPVWKPDACTQCNYCAIVCPHAVIRPFLFTKEELNKAPSDFQTRKAQGGAEVGGLNYSIQLATLDCTGCAVCVESCPDDALYMAPFGEAAEDQIPGWEFSKSVPNKGYLFDKNTVKGSQFQEPLMEFSGACAGCGETPYVKLLTQLFGDHINIANASGCSSVWGGTSTTNPYTSLPASHKHAGRGPAWGRSLFEDNAEYGFGMMLATLQRRKKLQDAVEAALEAGEIDNSQLKNALEKWSKLFPFPEKQSEQADIILGILPKENPDVPIVSYLIRNQDMLPPISQWIIGGDGWAYDIGFGGLDHVLARGENVKILVLDTEMYSNTGGQVSKSTMKSTTIKFASGGKKQNKKDLGQMAMLYDNVYVAQVALGADYGQTVKAIKEAEEYPGTSLIIAYSPCIDWGIEMKDMMKEQKKAVDSGYWPLYRYNPALLAKGEKPLQLDSRRIKGSLANYLEGQNRFASLTRTNKPVADKLHEGLDQYVHHRMNVMQRQSVDDAELLDMLKQAVGETTGDKILILYASETGNTAELAKMLIYEMKRRDVRVKALAFDDVDLADLKNEKTVILLAATCGQGEWPSNSRLFWKQIQDESLPADFLAGVKFATFGMGDSGYVFFNEVAKQFDDRFAALGATRIVPIGMGDDQNEDKWETKWQEWIPDVWNTLGTKQPENQLLPATHVVKMADSGTPDVDIITPQDMVGPGILCPMATNRLMTPGGRDVRHIEWDIRGTGITYAVGDALGVWSTNPTDRVTEFLNWYGVGYDQLLNVKDTTESRKPQLPENTTAGQLFTQVLDIFGKPKRMFWEVLQILASDSGEKKQLEILLSAEGKNDMRKLIDEHKLTYADLLQMFPSAKPSLEYMIDFVLPIKPRLYSIASAPEMFPDQIQLCIVQEDWTTAKGEERHGQSTWFVRNQAANLKWGTYKSIGKDPAGPYGTLPRDQAPMIPVRVNPAVVHVPEDPRVPLVMVGLGTGLAPFRAFIQQRKIFKDQGKEIGPMALYFGARFEKTEFLYGDEIEAYHKEGILTDLKKAFSRDQKEKIYAQHRIQEDPHLIYKYLVKDGGSFYLCGPAGGMPAQMRKAVVDAFVVAGGHTPEEADRMVRDMQIGGRYNVEVW